MTRKSATEIWFEQEAKRTGKEFKKAVHVVKRAAKKAEKKIRVIATSKETKKALRDIGEAAKSVANSEIAKDVVKYADTGLKSATSVVKLVGTAADSAGVAAQGVGRGISTGAQGIGNGLDGLGKDLQGGFGGTLFLVGAIGLVGLFALKG